MLRFELEVEGFIYEPEEMAITIPETATIAEAKALLPMLETALNDAIQETIQNTIESCFGVRPNNDEANKA